MPLIVTFMFAWFPSDLVLYWITNTVLSKAQRWNINRVVTAQEKKSWWTHLQSRSCDGIVRKNALQTSDLK